ncbi:MAG TPA: allantoicase, partial [Euzebya sp.]|nr:allantoicase [Euzebya sp.]
MTGLIDLAAKRLGGMVVAANDEFFAAKENLVDPLPPRFDPHAYTDRGKVMDGWETRRRRRPGSDWCIVRLGVAGVLQAVVVDTSFFRGNFPEGCELHGTVSTADIPPADAAWFPLLARTELRGDAVQRFEVDGATLATHVRLTIHPDGGVARLRLLGRSLVDLHQVADPGGRLNLAAATNGARAVACSDAFFSAPSNMISVGDGRDMGDGWETRRRRGPGEDWAVIELATTGLVERIEIDTTHFKGNYPDRCAVDALDATQLPEGTLDDPAACGMGAPGWKPAVEPSPMRPHARHVYDLAQPVIATHLRVVMIPDGGISRFRAHGVITDEGWRRAGLVHLNAMDRDRAGQALLACCGSTAWAEAMLARRPFADPDALKTAAGEIWQGLSTADHLEAFAAHPRIGETSPPATNTAATNTAATKTAATNSVWSAAEQSG